MYRCSDWHAENMQSSSCHIFTHKTNNHVEAVHTFPVLLAQSWEDQVQQPEWRRCLNSEDVTVSLLLPAGALRLEALIIDYFDVSQRDEGGWFVVTFMSCDFHYVSMF